MKKCRISFKRRSKSRVMLQISRTQNSTSQKRSISMGMSSWNMLTQASCKTWSSTRAGTTTKKTWTTSFLTSTTHANSRRISWRSSSCHNKGEMRLGIARSWTSLMLSRIKLRLQSGKSLKTGSSSSTWSSAHRLLKMMLVAPSAALETTRMMTRSCFVWDAPCLFTSHVSGSKPSLRSTGSATTAQSLGSREARWWSASCVQREVVQWSPLTYSGATRSTMITKLGRSLRRPGSITSRK